jgi:hypothetical protein
MVPSFEVNTDYGDGVGETTVASAAEEAVNRQKRAHSIDMRAPTQKKKKKRRKGKTAIQPTTQTGKRP